jgi:Uncharacterized protein conserved in bacteria (DUF2188)
MTSRNISKSPVAKGRTRVHVTPTEGGWQVRHDGAHRAARVYSSQTEAIEAAQSAIRRSGGEVRVEGRDGRIRESMTLGRDSMAKIAAVEGIHLSAESKRTLENLDRAGASGEERRRSIARQFGKKI